MSFVLDLQAIPDERGHRASPADVALQPSSWSLSTCFSNQSWAFC